MSLDRQHVATIVIDVDDANQYRARIVRASHQPPITIEPHATIDALCFKAARAIHDQRTSARTSRV